LNIFFDFACKREKRLKKSFKIFQKEQNLRSQSPGEKANL